MTHYARLCVALPSLAAVVPPAWREAKLARDGDWPPAHVTLMNSAEVRDALAGACQAPASAPFVRDGAGEPFLHPADARRQLVSAVRRVRTGPLRVHGLGVAVGAAGAAAAFVVVDWPAGGAFRNWMGLPKADFHITLGFDGEDPHDVRKNRGSLLRAPPGGWPRGEAGFAAMRAALVARVEGLRAAQRSNAAQPMQQD